MATPDLVAQMAAAHMGVEPPAPAEAPAAPAPAADKQTPTEAAVEQGSPKDEADAMGDDAILYEIDGRKLSPQQIKSTFDRYRDLNYKHQEYADLHKVADIASRLGMGNNPSEVARTLAALIKGQQSNPTMGGDADRDDNRTSTVPGDDELSKWEEENAAKLPPGYRDLQSNLRNFGENQKQMMDLIRGVLAQSGQTAASAADTAVQARQQRDGLMKERINHNLSSISQQLGLDAAHAQDFMIFAGERGYTVEDFIDPNLVGAIMSDFKNNMQTPEMERLRQIAQRRQAFTGNLGSTPAASGATPTAPDANPRLAGLVDEVMSRRA